ncbi:MAG: ImmA/IrrE family metallo-endopeptidase [Candidatus Sedimenticola sp. (ex Thyasira tokunagai)]
MPYRTDKNGVPVFYRQDIEIKAEEVIEYVSPETLTKASISPLSQISTKFREEFGVQFFFEEDLGFTKNGNKILGKFVTEPRSIFVDKSLDFNDPKWSFTLAHELGHLVLHRKVDISLGNEHYSVFSDTVEQIKVSLVKPWTSHQWLEWQANSFASSLLMPREPYIEAFHQALSENDNSRNKPYIYLDHQPHNMKLLHDIKSALISIYQVSSSAMEVRMKELGLLLDHRPGKIKHAIEFLREE